MICRFDIILQLFFVSLHLASCLEDSLNVLVKPQARQCFYEDISTPQKLNIEVFVQSGGKSDVLLEVRHTVSAMFHNPSRYLVLLLPNMCDR